MTPTHRAIPGTALLLASLFGGCGYSATPVTLVVTTLHAADLTTHTLDLEGTSDPAASQFDDGLFISARWGAAEEGVPTMELWLDIDHAGLPASLDLMAVPTALTLAAGQVRARLGEREADGTLRAAVNADSAKVTVRALASDGQRTLSAGAFLIELAADSGSPYASLAGTWESAPRPGSASILPGPDSAPAFADSARPGDPASGGDVPPRPTGDRSGGDTETVPFDASGCSCGTSDSTQTLPSEGDTGSSTSDGSGGCDCQGDNGPSGGDPDTSGSDPDNNNTSSSSGGCDCTGESPSPTESAKPHARRSEPSAPEPICIASEAPLPKPHRFGVCRTSPVKAAFETSPILFLFGLGWRRRRWR